MLLRRGRSGRSSSRSSRGGCAAARGRPARAPSTCPGDREVARAWPPGEELHFGSRQLEARAAGRRPRRRSRRPPPRSRGSARTRRTACARATNSATASFRPSAPMSHEVASGRLERTDRIFVLRREAKGRTARGKHVQPGCRRQQLRQSRRGVEHVLEVVAPPARAHGRVEPRRAPRAPLARRSRERSGDGRSPRRRARAAEGRQVEKVRTVCVLAAQLFGHGQRHPGLAGAADPGERQQSARRASAGVPATATQLEPRPISGVGGAWSAGQGGTGAVADRGPDPDGGFVPRALELQPRLEPEVVDDIRLAAAYASRASACRPVRRAPRSAARGDAPGTGSRRGESRSPPRAPHDDRREIRRRFASSSRKTRSSSRRASSLRTPFRIRVGMRRRRARVTAPVRAPPPWLARRARLHGARTRRVELTGLDHELVARPIGTHTIVAENLAQPVHRDLERVRAACGGVSRPDRVDQPLAWDDLVATKEQECEQRPLSGAAERDFVSASPALRVGRATLNVQLFPRGRPPRKCHQPPKPW